MPIKEVIKEKFNTGTIKPEHIITSVSEFKSVSFDVFDTLLKRNVQKPTDVFRAMEHSNPSLEGFAEARIKAEEKVRKKSTYEEVILDEIYAELKNDGFLAEVSPTDELNAEAELLTVNQPIKEVYDYCLSSGKDIYIISDIYLPGDFICGVLKKLGYTGYKELYVSSESRKTKSSGSLYDLALSENNIKPSDLIHIGDSIKSDYVVPKKKGISAIHIPSNVTGRTGYKHEAESLQMACMKAFIDNTISSDGDSYYHFGYECFGPFLWGFSHWLIKNCEEQNINRIFFFSRDGWIMKRAFDFVNKDASLMSVYLEVSRRSLRIPTLWMDLEFDSVIKMIGAKLIPLVSVFDGVGLDINYYGELIKKYGFDKETVFDRKDVLNNTNLRALFEELKPDIISVSKREYETLKGYIEQNNLYGKFAIVDIGWSGSMQRYLVQTLGKIGINCDIYGYYTGVAAFYTRNTDAAPDMKMKGYLFDFMNDKNSHDVRSCFVGLFESIFLERGGSVKNYAYAAGQPGGGTCYAVRYDYEYLISGKPSTEMLCVQRIQEAALEFIKGIANISIFEKFAYSPQELFTNIYEVGAHPKKRDIKMFADFRFFDEGKVLYLAKPKSLVHYLAHQHEIKNDFLLSRWKTGFMKALFKLPLDYNRAYEFLLRYK